MYRLTKVMCILAISLAITACAFTYPKLDAYEEELSADVYLVPIGLVAPEYLISLADYYENTFGIKMGVTEQLTHIKSLVNIDRQHIESDGLIRQMKYQFWNYSFNEDAIYIGITHADLHIADKPKDFIFTHRVGGNFAVISNNRVEDKSEWNFIDIEEVKPNFRKLVSKTIGLMHFNEPLNSNPRSVLYDNIRSLRDLEYVNEKTIYSDILGQKVVKKSLAVF
ncbi:MAG: hypothetical protein V7785_00625 [Bermanella sp.]